MKKQQYRAWRHRVLAGLTAAATGPSHTVKAMVPEDEPPPPGYKAYIRDPGSRARYKRWLTTIG